MISLLTSLGASGITLIIGRIYTGGGNFVRLSSETVQGTAPHPPRLHQKTRTPPHPHPGRVNPNHQLPTRGELPLGASPRRAPLRVPLEAPRGQEEGGRAAGVLQSTDNQTR